MRLTEIFRQAQTSRIIVNAHRINAGQFVFDERPESSSDFYTILVDTPEVAAEKLAQVVTDRIPKRFGLHSIDNIQVLTPMNRGGLGARALNQLLQSPLNGASEPKVTRFGITLPPPATKCSSRSTTTTRTSTTETSVRSTRSTSKTAR